MNFINESSSWTLFLPAKGKAEEVQNQAEDILIETSSEVVHERSKDMPAMEKSQAVGVDATKLASLSGTSIRENQSIKKALQSSTTQFLSSNLGGQFILFPKLPIELRLRIWELALPGPRIIEIYMKWLCRPHHPIEIQANNPPLNLFHVNRESREVAAKKYMPLSNARISLERGDIEVYCCHVKFDPVKDIIYIPWPVAQFGLGQTFLMNGHYWSENARSQVQYLAMDSRMYAKDNYNRLLSFTIFTALKEFTIVVHEKDESQYLPKMERVERWRMPGTSLAFEEPRQMEPENIDPKHKRFIEEWRSIVSEKMVEELEIAEAIGIEWSIPKINVKILTRNGVRCCWRKKWGINGPQAEIVRTPLGMWH